MSTNHAAAAKSRGGKAAPKKSAVRVTDENIHKLTKIFKLLGDESRLKILLGLAEHGEMHVSALCALLGSPTQPVSQPAVSHHLTLMRLTGLVTYRREGKNNYYRLESRDLCELLEQVFSDCGNGHKALQFNDFALHYKRGR